MSATAISISSQDEAFAYIERALRNEFESDIIELTFDNWPQFRLNIKGDRYHSTLPTSLMRSLVDLQASFNKMYAEIVYGKSAKALSQEERNALEIVFKVEEGSTELLAEFSQALSEIGKAAMERMTGGQVMAVVLGTALIFGGVTAYYFHETTGADVAKAAQQHAVMEQLVRSNSKVAEINANTLAAYASIMKSAKDAEEITIGETTFTADDIDLVTKRERSSSSLQRLDGVYQITALKVKPDSYLIELFDGSDRSFKAELFKGHLNQAEMSRLMNAFTAESGVSLNIVARVANENVSMANIVGVNDAANGEQVAQGDLSIPSLRGSDS